jgi:hypothetical protein
MPFFLAKWNERYLLYTYPFWVAKSSRNLYHIANRPGFFPDAENGTIPTHSISRDRMPARSSEYSFMRYQ